jgi:hypothetical protein
VGPPHDGHRREEMLAHETGARDPGWHGGQVGRLHVDDPLRASQVKPVRAKKWTASHAVLICRPDRVSERSVPQHASPPRALNVEPSWGTPATPNRSVVSAPSILPTRDDPQIHRNQPTSA